MKILAPLESFCRAASGGTRRASVRVGPDCPPGVVRAADALSEDFGRVLGDFPGPADLDVYIHAPGSDPSGFLGEKREAFLLEVQPGRIDIRGSDKRGLIYGIYELSQQIGVSPLHWWADVPVQRASGLVFEPGTYTAGEPAVEFRGIFLNDEYPCLGPWAKETFGGLNSAFYQRIFEYILRCRGNFLWPAMWDDCLYDDDPATAPLADEMGIVLGTSHHEPLGRAWKEWKRHGRGPWNLDQNRDFIEEYWRGGVERTKGLETVLTVGMRGDGDEPLTDPDYAAKIRQIIRDQRKIIQNTLEKPAESVPQLWAIYKEVQDVYDEGRGVPEDVLILLADDNWGNLRRLPTATELGRSGGFGLYYHFDYVGGPRNYKWLNSTALDRCWEQMHRAYLGGIQRMWIVNVGDFKLQEFPTQFFLTHAWYAADFDQDQIRPYAEAWAARNFGTRSAAGIAEVLLEHGARNAARKPELLDPNTMAVEHFDEAARVCAAFDALERRAEEVGRTLSAEHASAYFQLVQFPVSATANLYRLHAAVGRARLLAGLGAARAATDQSVAAEGFFARDKELAAEYHAVSGGKWNHLAAQTHISYTYWQQPEADQLPEIPPIAAAPAHAPAGRILARSAGVDLLAPGGALLVDRWSPLPPQIDLYGAFEDTVAVSLNSSATGAREAAALPQSAAELPQSAAGTQEAAVPTQSAASASAAAGLQVSVADRAPGWIRVEVQVDWGRIPSGTSAAHIELCVGSDRVRMALDFANFPLPADLGEHCFLESAGLLSIPASGFADRGASSMLRWVDIGPIGRAVSAPAILPRSGADGRAEAGATAEDSGAGRTQPGATTKNLTSGPRPIPGAVNAANDTSTATNPAAEMEPADLEAWLEYRFYLFRPGPRVLRVEFAPLNRFLPRGHHRLGCELDGRDLGEWDLFEAEVDWDAMVAEHRIVRELLVGELRSGEHRLRLRCLDPAFVVQRITIAPPEGLPRSYFGPPDSRKIGSLKSGKP